MSAKRDAGEGTIRQLPSGRWSWAIMTGYNDNGTKHYVRRTADTKKELLAEIDKFKYERRLGKSHDPPGFSNFAHKWYERYKSNISVATQSSYEFTLKKLCKYWGNKPLDMIKASDVTDMLIHFNKQNLSSSYITKLRGMLHQIFHSAVADDLVFKNPVEYAQFRTVSIQKVSRPKESFSEDEIRKICEMPVCKLRDWIIISIFSGLRMEEMLALKGADILDDGRAINIDKAVNMDRGKPIIGKTKNKSSIRVVPLPSCIQSLANKYSTYGDSFIWQSPQISCQLINPSVYRKKFKAFCKKTDIHVLTPHCCRHTFVTLLRARDIDVELVKALVGHTRGSVTEHYNHIQRERLQSAVNVLNELWTH